MAVLVGHLNRKNVYRFVITFGISLILMVSVFQHASNSKMEHSLSWLDHLCPGNQLRKTNEGQLRLTWEAPSPNTIFFMQTSCVDSLTVREACAVESFAHHHPERQILLLLTSLTVNQSNPIMKVLLEISNFRAAYLDLDEVFSEEPLRSWHKNRKWLIFDKKSSMAVSDSSRAEILRRFGGTYIDLDAIALRPLPNGTNWIAAFYGNRVNAALSSFLPEQEVLQRVVGAIPQVFNPFECCSIGPDLITSKLVQLCPDSYMDIITENLDEPTACGDVMVFPTKSFYPINYDMSPQGFGRIMKAGTGEEFLKNTKAYSLHLYSSLTSKDKLYLGGGSILEEVARKNCPKVFSVQSKISYIM